MIAQLTGNIIEKNPSYIVIDVNGVGYEIFISMQTFCVLPDIGKKTTLLTHLLVREDAHILFGFAAKDERITFRELLKISGIGAKTALAILSVMSKEELATAVEANDIRKISSVPGIGKKTAERMILELRGKLTAFAAENIESIKSSSQIIEDTINTLIALGYKESEAQKATKSLPNNIEVGEAVKLALKNLSK